MVIECCVGPCQTFPYVLIFAKLIVSSTSPHLEFIHLISSEANEICEQDSKKTIAPEHIIGALKVRLSVSLSPYRPIAWTNG